MRYLAFLLAFLCLPMAVLAQDDDPGLLAGLLQDALTTEGQTVRVRGFEGALSSQATIALISVSDDNGEWFRAEEVLMDWNRSALLRGRVDVNTFSAQRILLARLPGSEEPTVSAEATPFAIPELPVSVRIGEVSAPLVDIGAPLLGEAASFSVSGSALVDADDLALSFDLLRTDGPEAQLSLALSYVPSTRILSARFDAQEDANGLTGRVLGVPNEPALSFQVEGEAPIDNFTALVDLKTDDVTLVSGDVEILAPEAGNGWDVQVDIAGNPSRLLTGKTRDFFGDAVALKGRVTRTAEGRFELPQFELSAEKLALSGQASVAANGWPETLDVRGALLTPDGVPVVLPFGEDDTEVADITFEAKLDERLTIDAQLVDLKNPAVTIDTAQITARGAVDPASLSSNGTFELDLDWVAQGIGLSDPAMMEAVGDRLEGAARIDYVSGQPTRVTGIEAKGEDYGLSGTATWDFAQDIPLVLDLRLAAPDLARFSGLAGRALGGRMDAKIAGAVGPISGTADLVVDATTLDLTIDQEIVDRLAAGVGSAKLDIRRDETGTTLRAASVATSAVRMTATGKLSSADSYVRFDGRLTNLEKIYPGNAEGAAELAGHVHLSGTQLSSLNVQAKLQNEGGRVRLPVAGGLTLENGDLNIQANGGPNGNWSTHIVASDFRSTQGRAASVELTGEGQLAQSEAGDILAADGQMTVSGTNVRLSDSHLARALGASPVGVTKFSWITASEQLTISAMRIETGAASVTGTALINTLISQPDAQFSANIRADQLSPLSGLAGVPLRGRADVDLTGTYKAAGGFDVHAVGNGRGLGIGNAILDPLLAGDTSFDAQVTGDENGLSHIDANVENAEIRAAVAGPLSNLGVSGRLRNIGLIAPDFQGPLGLVGTVRQSGGSVGVDIDVDGPGGTALAVGGRVSDGTRADLSITGSGPLGLANAFIAPRRLNGRAALDLRVRGPLELQNVTGTIAPQAAELSAPTLGIILNPITGNLALSNGAANIDLTAQGNNGGAVGLSGRIGLDTLETALTATLSDFGIRDPALYDSSVDGTVTITGRVGRELLIGGDLRVGRTEVQLPTSGIGSFGEIPNIQHLGATRPVMRTLERAGLTEDPGETQRVSSGSDTRLDVTLRAPGQIFVRGRGLDSELGGTLRLTGTTSNIIPQGGFELIRGRLDILNQRFVVTEGRIQSRGSFDPFLRFVAVTEANGIEVRVILDGPASAPDISFTSSPELPEDEVLAQLLFGRNIANLSALQALELANAIATLAGGGSGGLLSNLRDQFGLDNLDVSQTEEGGTAVRAGKYISDNIYTDVVVEGGGRTEINLNLDITPDLTARGSVDNTGNSSIGIFFERDY